MKSEKLLGFSSSMHPEGKSEADQLSMTMSQRAIWLKDYLKSKEPKNDKQEQLVKLLIHFEAMQIDDDDKIKQSLYELFFDWQSKKEKQMSKLLEENQQNMADEAIDPMNQTFSSNKEQEKLELIKRAQLRRDQAMQEFQDRGGFSRVLNDIFNPNEIKALELDSVF